MKSRSALSITGGVVMLVFGVLTMVTSGDPLFLIFVIPAILLAIASIP